MLTETGPSIRTANYLTSSRVSQLWRVAATMVLVDALGALRGLVKVKTRNCDIDSAVFKLHYRVTALFLFSCCLLVTCNGLLGNPIKWVWSSHPIKWFWPVNMSLVRLCTLSNDSSILACQHEFGQVMYPIKLFWLVNMSLVRLCTLSNDSG